jgi:ABC-2 type transport system permease protein
VSPLLTAVRAGLARGWIELRQTLASAQDVIAVVFFPGLLLGVMLLMRGSTVADTSFSLGAMALPGVLGMLIAFQGVQGAAWTLLVEREDGTLLRAKAIPNGMVGYLISKIIQQSGNILINLLVMMVPGVLLFDGLSLGATAWLTLLWVVALGLLATLPWGAVLGSLLASPRDISMIMLPLFAVVGISGVFYPIAQLPGWLQGLAQVFPVYWLGLGMRSALLPAQMAAVEIGGSWRHLETLAMLGIWAVIGLAVAPVVLRRMARRESGAVLDERRQKAMQAVT